MPAAAVIPAPLAYIKVAAVKKLVVGYLLKVFGPLFEMDYVLLLASACESVLCLIAWRVPHVLYFEENRVLTAGNRLVYTSMG